MSDINNCELCGKKYKVCSKCERNGTFKWRLHFCSIKCFTMAMEGELKLITVQYKSKTYNCKEYDFKEGVYITTNGLELNEDDIQGFILPLDEFKKLKYGRFTKPKQPKQIENEEE